MSKPETDRLPMEDGITLAGLQAALKQFRLDVIEVLADIEIEMNSMQTALAESGCLDSTQLVDLRASAQALRLNSQPVFTSGFPPLTGFENQFRPKVKNLPTKRFSTKWRPFWPFFHGNSIVRFNALSQKRLFAPSWPRLPE